MTHALRCHKDAPPTVDLRSQGPRVTSPVRARWAKIRKRLPSSRELASFHPPTETLRKLICLLRVPRTGSPSLHSCPASDGASSFLLASALHPSRGLATPRWARRTMRPIDFCHPNENCVYPHLIAFPDRCRGLHRVGASRALGPVRLVRRTGCFHDTRERFGGSERTKHTSTLADAPLGGRHMKTVDLERGRCLPT